MRSGMQKNDSDSSPGPSLEGSFRKSASGMYPSMYLLVLVYLCLKMKTQFSWYLNNGSVWTWLANLCARHDSLFDGWMKSINIHLRRVSVKENVYPSFKKQYHYTKVSQCIVVLVINASSLRCISYIFLACTLY